MKWVKKSNGIYNTDIDNGNVIRYIISYNGQFWLSHVLLINEHGYNGYFISKNSFKSNTYGKDEIRSSTKEEAMMVCERHYKLLILQ